jgi:hygromycin-B 4-O-kinase
MSESQQVDLKEIEAFLKTNFSDSISHIGVINGGERSKAYVFLSSGIKYIFRINNHDDGFKKDEYAFEHFSEFVPIPKILKIDSFKDGYYSISEFCSGSPLTNDNRELSSTLIEDIFTVADKIHSVPISTKTGYGVADTNGNTNYHSWEEWILKANTVVTKDDGSFYSWNEVKKIPFVDEKIIIRLFAQIKDLAQFIPLEKQLIHCDFGPGNIMVSNNLVTGVIDWNEFGYGDFLFDIAWLDFWIDKTDFKEAYRAHFQSNNLTIPFYEERMMCHKLFIGLNTLGIYSTIGWEDGYNSTLDRINKIKF